MIDRFAVEHCEQVSERAFGDVVACFEAEPGDLADPAVIPREIAAATRPADVESHIRAHGGRNGCMRFLTGDHGPGWAGSQWRHGSGRPSPATRRWPGL